MAKPHKDDEAPVIATTLGEQTSFAGTLRFKDWLRIEGKFEGEIDAMGRLYIDADAVVSARRIRATNVVVGGMVRGDIEAADRLEMLPTAKVYGNVRTAKLRIADGVVFEGSCEMIRDPQAFDPFAQAVETAGGAGEGRGNDMNQGRKELISAASELVARLSESELSLSCAESCSGGVAAAAITEASRSLRGLLGGFVAYSNDCKTRILGVSLATLSSHGAVSREAAKEMAAGALTASGADIAFATTGMAGPEGGTEATPVGGVWIAWATASGARTETYERFAGDREAVRVGAALRALRGAIDLAASLSAPTEVVPADGTDIDNR